MTALTPSRSPRNRCVDAFPGEENDSSDAGLGATRLDRGLQSGRIFEAGESIEGSDEKFGHWVGRPYWAHPLYVFEERSIIHTS